MSDYLGAVICTKIVIAKNIENGLKKRLFKIALTIIIVLF